VSRPLKRSSTGLAGGPLRSSPSAAPPRPYEAYGYDYDFGCRSGYYEVTVFFLNGDQAEYRPCLRPPEIDPFVTNV
jgi:hypothetical protein